MQELIKKMPCPFCGSRLTLRERKSYTDEEYELWCSNCGARGAIFRKKKP
jgi:transcription elongation factor Elf1